ncbi:aldose epimerase family protein [Flagellimonas sp. DF-77]|uniref:aldose epimerase family protein n=1 Tax=Flagellimonas algarum TaxID=3230298 RepID=UPI0033940D05
MPERIDIKKFGIAYGTDIQLISLKNEQGTEFQCLDFGATWHAMKIKGKKKKVDVVVAPKTAEGYHAQFGGSPYHFGSCVGRFAGRIGKGSFSVAGQNYPIAHTNGVHLHGGNTGISKKIWNIDKLSEGPDPSVTLSCTSPHLEDGYPGNLDIEVTYTLTENNAVTIAFSAVSDEDTILNLTNHVYLNLGGESILEHELQVDAQEILQIDRSHLPTGTLLPIANTGYDFSALSNMRKIGAINGLDDTYVLNGALGDHQAVLRSKESGLQLCVATDQPAIVIFAPPKLDFVKAPKEPHYASLDYPAICFEAQNFPDAPNHDHFPSAVLKKEARYHNTTTFAFSLWK